MMFLLKAKNLSLKFSENVFLKIQDKKSQYRSFQIPNPCGRWRVEGGTVALLVEKKKYISCNFGYILFEENVIQGKCYIAKVISANSNWSFHNLFCFVFSSPCLFLWIFALKKNQICLFTKCLAIAMLHRIQCV